MPSPVVPGQQQEVDLPDKRPEAKPAAEVDLPQKFSPLEGVYKQVSDFDPQQAATTLDLAQKTGMSPDAVEADPAGAKRSASARPSSFFEELESQYPGTAKFVGSPATMAVAHDDLENLAKHEGILKRGGDFIEAGAASLMSGALQEELGMIRYAQLQGATQSPSSWFRLGSSVAGMESMPQGIKARADEISARLKELEQYRPQGIFKRGLYGIGEFLPQIAGGLGYGAKYAAAPVAASLAGGVTAPLAPTALTIGGLAGETDYNYSLMTGLAYDKLLNVKGLDPNAAAIAAVATGAVASSLSLVKLDAILGTIPGGKDFLSKFTASATEKVLSSPKTFKLALTNFTKSFLAAGVKGGAAVAGITAANIAGEEAAKAMSPGKFEHTTVGKAAAEIATSGAEGAVSFSFLGMPGGMVGLKHEVAQLRHAEQTRDVYRALAEAANESKLKKRVPEAYKQAVADLTKNGPVENIYMPIEEATAYFQSKNIDPATAMQELGVSDSYEQAKVTGDNVRIPTAVWADKIVGTEHEEGMADFVKFSQDSLTVNEATKKVEEVKEKTEEAATAADGSPAEAPAKKATAAAAAKTIVKEVSEQLRAAGLTPQEVSADPKLYGSFFKALGESTGEDPLELWSKFKPTIEKVASEELLPRSSPKSGILGQSEIPGAKDGRPAEKPAGSESPSDGGRAGRVSDAEPLAAIQRGPEAGGRLANLPGKSPGPTLEIRQAAKNYHESAGIPFAQPAEYLKADPERGKRIADAFVAMKHDPKDPRVAASYNALIAETLAQYQVIKASGLKIEHIPKAAENPYKNSQELIDDVRRGHIWFFPTDQGFGSDDQFNDHPLMAPTAELRADGQVMLANDVFRVVHDIFGHVKEGLTFGQDGEDNAWQSHVRMYSDLAAPAMTSETRGQNSWVNFGPAAAENRAVPGSKYADQKAGLLPDFAWKEGRSKDVGATTLDQAAKRGSITFKDGSQFKISVLPSADRSTFLHETGHYFLEVMNTLAKDRPEMADELALVRDWWSDKAGHVIEVLKKDIASADPSEASRLKSVLTDIQERGGIKFVKEVAANFTGQQDKAGKATAALLHEYFARGFEAYTMEGKAPNRGLKRAFDRFRDWLVGLYKDVRDLNVELTPEVRGFMDGMLSTKDEVARAYFDAGYTFEVPKDMPPELAGKVRGYQERARREAEDILLRETMKDYKAKSKEATEAARTRLESEAQEQVTSRREFKMRVELEDKFGKGFENTLKKGQEGKANEKDAAALETISEVNGYGSVAEMAKSVLSFDVKAEMKAHVDAGMKDFEKPSIEDIRMEALVAIHTTKTTELMALERQALGDIVHGSQVSAEASKRRRAEARLEAQVARQEAERILTGKTAKDAVNFRTFVTAERNAAIKASKALAAGDYEAAAKFKGQQLLNHSLAAASLKLKREVESTIGRLDKLADRGRDLAGMPYGFTRQGDALLAKFGFAADRREDSGTLLKIAQAMQAKNESPTDIANTTGFFVGPDGSWRQETLLDFQARVNENYHDMSLPESVLTGELKKRYELTLGELRDLNNAVRQIQFVGKGHNRFLNDFIKVGLKEAGAELRKRIESVVGTPYAESKKLGSANNSALKDKLQALMAMPDKFVFSMTNMLTLAEYLDGGHDGPAHDYIYRVAKTASDRKMARWEKMTGEVNGILIKHYTPKEFANFKKERQFHEAIGRYLTKEQVFSMALNWGNEGNRDRIRQGEHLSDQQVMSILDTLDKKDWDAAQDLWDHLNTYWPDVVKQEMTVRGLEPVPVEPSEVVTQHGTYKGGYYPISFDFKRSAEAYTNEVSKTELYKQFSTVAAHTNSGHTKERTRMVDRPVRLSTDVLFNHLENVVHDLEFRKAVIDISRFLKEKDVRTSLEGALGVDGFRSIDDWLKAMGSDQSQTVTVADGFFKFFRFNSTYASLGLRIFTLPMDVTGNYFNGVWEIGAGDMTKAVKDFAVNPGEIKSFVDSKSQRMTYRSTTRDRDIMDLHKKWDGRKSAIKQYAFTLQAIADEAISYPLWNTVYKDAVAKYGEEKAVHIADEAVTRTIGSGDKIDLVGVQRGGEFKKVMSMYYSWMSMMFNRFWLDKKNAGLEWNRGNMGAAITIMAKATFMAWGLQALNENFWRELVRNKQSDDPDSMMKRIVSRTLSQPLGYVWVARDIGSLVVDRAVGNTQSHYKFSPLEQSIETIFEPLGQAVNIAFSQDKEYDQKFAESVARSAAQLRGVPQQLNTWVFNFIDWIEGNGELTWRDAMTRRTKT